MRSLKELNRIICSCRKCPRLVKNRESVVPRRAFLHQPYWRRPLPGFGDMHAKVLIIGLAPSAHGGNRTGRIFTGDPSGAFLMKGLYEEGFANRPNSDDVHDRLKLQDVYITAAVKCVPPKNLPTSKEQSNCFPYLREEIALLKKLKAILVLGRLAYGAYINFLREQNIETKGKKFAHGATYAFPNMAALYCSYHPSPQNTNTGRLSMTSFRKTLRTIRNKLEV